jgi:hypothetical protein
VSHFLLEKDDYDTTILPEIIVLHNKIMSIFNYYVLERKVTNES